MTETIYTQGDIFQFAKQLRALVDERGPAQLRADVNDAHDLVLVWPDGRTVRVLVP